MNKFYFKTYFGHFYKCLILCSKEYLEQIQKYFKCTFPYFPYLTNLKTNIQSFEIINYMKISDSIFSTTNIKKGVKVIYIYVYLALFYV